MNKNCKQMFFTDIGRPFYQPIIMGSAPFRVRYNEVKSFPEHWHGDMEILYVPPESESVWISVNGEKYELTPRSAIFISGTVVHSVITDNENIRMLLIEMGTAFLGDCFSVFSGRRFSEPFMSFEENESEASEKIEQIFRGIIDICKNASSTESGGDENKFSPSVRMRISSMLFELASLMADNLKMIVSERRIKQLEAVKAVQNVLTYVENSYSEKITLETASSMAGYEKTRFSQIFKAAVGVSFHKYLTERRMRAAVILLEKTTLPIAHVGESVGINHAKSFSRLIREFYGKTPGEIRKEASSNTN